MAELDLQKLRERWSNLPGSKWILATSCSYRRILTEYENLPVLWGETHSDGQPDVVGAPGVLDALTESRHVIPELLDIIEELQGKLDEAVNLDGMMLACSSRVKRGIKKLQEENSGLRAARIAYAKEFPPATRPDYVNKVLPGDPDVGRLHENIRKLKAELEAERKKRRRWEDIAFFLAAGHAETMELEYKLRGSSQKAKSRWRHYAQLALVYLEGTDWPDMEDAGQRELIFVETINRLRKSLKLRSHRP